MSAALLAIAAGGLLQAYGNLQAGEAEGRAAEMNAQMADQNASLALERAVMDERKLRAHGMKQIGDIRAGYGASGVTATGSALDVLRESAGALELDAQNIKYQGEIDAMSFRNEARVARYRGEYARSSSQINAAAAILGAAGQSMKKG
jgi:hypothetical protein